MATLAILLLFLSSSCSTLAEEGSDQLLGAEGTTPACKSKVQTVRDVLKDERQRALDTRVAKAAAEQAKGLQAWDAKKRATQRQQREGGRQRARERNRVNFQCADGAAVQAATEAARNLADGERATILGALEEIIAGAEKLECVRRGRCCLPEVPELLPAAFAAATAAASARHPRTRSDTLTHTHSPARPLHPPHAAARRTA
jgi:hypothetical protein